VAATEHARRARAAVVLATLALVACAAPLRAAVLPEDRVDATYHYYDGDGVTIEGPALLARHRIGDSVSVAGSYYVDSVSGASIDAVTTASPYEERRTQFGANVDYLHGSTLVGLSYTNSDENDYTANTYGISIAQEIFAGMTTVSMGYVRGVDEVRRSDNPDFAADIDRHSFRVGITQVLSRRAIAELAFETISDEGFLNNPYRQVRYVDADAPGCFALEPEVYPETRTSNAVALRGRLHLPFRAALQADYRYFVDDWDITGHTAEVVYTHGVWDRWTIDVGYRYHTQTGADFFSDLFPFEASQNFRARNKEISPFDSHAIRVGVSWDFLTERRAFVERGSVHVGFEHILFRYDEFRDVRELQATAGGEPLFEFEANVVQSMISFWF